MESGCGGPGGARGGAALEMQRSQLEEEPEAVIQTLRQDMARSLRSDRRAGQDAAEFNRRFDPFSQHQDLGHSSPRLWRRFGTLRRCKTCRWLARR